MNFEPIRAMLSFLSGMICSLASGSVRPDRFVVHRSGEALQFRNASGHRCVFVAVVVGMQKIDLDREKAIVSGFGELAHELLVVHQTVSDGRGGEEIPRIRGNAAAGLEIFNVRRIHVPGKLLHPPDRIVEEAVAFITLANASTASWNAFSTPSGRGPKGEVRSAAITRTGLSSSRVICAMNARVGAVGSPAD